MNKVLTNLEWHKPDEKPARGSDIIVLRDWKGQYNSNFDLGVINVYYNDFNVINYNVLAWAYLPDAKELMRDLDISTEVNYENEAIDTILA